VAKVLVPVTFGVLTTMAAFSPMLFVDGLMGAASRGVPQQNRPRQVAAPGDEHRGCPGPVGRVQVVS